MWSLVLSPLSLESMTSNDAGTSSSGDHSSYLLVFCDLMDSSSEDESVASLDELVGGRQLLIGKIVVPDAAGPLSALGRGGVKKTTFFFSIKILHYCIQCTVHL